MLLGEMEGDHPRHSVWAIVTQDHARIRPSRAPSSAPTVIAALTHRYAHPSSNL
jgi:hypothetical protein